MKKVFIQIRQWILGHRKKLIYGTLALFIFQISFFCLGGIGIENRVFAEGEVKPQDKIYEEKAQQWHETLSFVQKVVYVLIYPFLVVAGKLADNSFVYGEIFGFDAVLWQLWNIVRNIANFALGFIFIFYIFKYLITEDKKFGPKQIILKSLLAGVGIQASRFIMAVLVDLSTILAYGIGGLPVSILNENTISDTEDSLKNNPYILKNVVYVDVKDIDTYHMYLTNMNTGDVQAGLYYISECQTFSYKNGAFSEELILAPKMIYYIEKKGNSEIIKKTDQNRCHFYGQVYYFSEPYLKMPSCTDKDDCETKQGSYKDDMTSAIGEIRAKSSGDVVGFITDAKILQIGDAHSTGGVLGSLGPVMYSDGDQLGLDLYNKWTGEDGKTSRLQDILDGKSYVGIFTALYSSLMNSGRGVIPSDNGVYSDVLKVALSVGHAIAIGIPLIVVAIVFMMRVGILWMAIALSPLIVLLGVFELDKELGKDGLLSYLTVKNLLLIIFAPAVICFAISMSTVLVEIISKLNLESINTMDKEILGGLIKLDIGGLSIGLGKLIVSALGIAVTWFLVWAAVSMSKLGESGIVVGLKNLAESSLGSIPIVPIPGKDGKGVEFIGANSAFGLNGRDGIISTISNKVKGEFERKDQNAVDEWLDSDEAAKKAEEKRNTVVSGEYGDKLVSLNVEDLGADWRVKEIEIGEGDNKQKVTFNSLGDGQKKEVIEKINNISDKNLLAAFGKVGKIEIGDGNNKVVYNFDANKGYVEQKNPTT